jgi:hypothetical protein
MLSEKFRIMTLGPAKQFLGIVIHHDSNGTGISLGVKAFITMFLK